MIANSTRITANTYSTLKIYSFTPILVLKRGSQIKWQWHSFLECGENVIWACGAN